MLGAVAGALAGAVGLKLWEVLVQRRSGGGDGGSDGGGDGRSTTQAEVEGGEGKDQIEGTAVAEETVGAQQAQIQALEDQLAVRVRGWFGDGCRYHTNMVERCSRRHSQSRVILRSLFLQGQENGARPRLVVPLLFCIVVPTGFSTVIVGRVWSCGPKIVCLRRRTGAGQSDSDIKCYLWGALRFFFQDRSARTWSRLSLERDQCAGGRARAAMRKTRTSEKKTISDVDQTDCLFDI